MVRSLTYSGIRDRSSFFLHLHKAPFAQALIDYPDEPLEAPWSASVLAVTLEAGPYVTQIAKSWSELDPVLAPRWWHIYFHTFAATVVQSSLVVKCPRSKLVQHALDQITVAIDIFETAAVTGAPVAMLLPRAKSLRTDALRAIQSTRRITASMRASNGPGVVSTSKEPANLDILGAATQLSRKPRHSSVDSESSPSPHTGAAVPAEKGEPPRSSRTTVIESNQVLPPQSESCTEASRLAHATQSFSTESPPPGPRTGFQYNQASFPLSLAVQDAYSSHVEATSYGTDAQPYSNLGSSSNYGGAQTTFAPFQAGFDYCGSRGQCDATNFVSSPRYLAESVIPHWTGQLTSPASGTNGSTTLPSDDLRDPNYAAMAEAMRMRATEISRSLARPHAGQHPSLHVSIQGRESQGNQIGMPISNPSIGSEGTWSLCKAFVPQPWKRRIYAHNVRPMHREWYAPHLGSNITSIVTLAPEPQGGYDSEGK
ncbi:BZ3500_MvSof-1268-A1-R1_Chr12-2g03836 [Microbotryum saponariae]|uniref:BZ3500_MvSof-1268-A1-R1_Chr12-2g03836 protein n=1 Tax=Microbotryum saponariae TaxID=289078 RepID=A0A2X0KN73_9BASI|nr:BZ3500_MvSof-1268-A1-R1_Chr12-2g03836 [Microbotryum saponariae]